MAPPVAGHCVFCGIALDETGLQASRPADIQDRIAYCPDSPSRRHVLISAVPFQQGGPIRAILDGPEWRYGYCSGCGLDDLPVKGPPDAGLCRYCDELRILAPRPKAAITRQRPAIPPRPLSSVFLLAGIAACFLPFPGWLIGLGFIILSILSQ